MAADPGDETAEPNVSGVGAREVIGSQLEAQAIFIDSFFLDADDLVICYPLKVESWEHEAGPAFLLAAYLEMSFAG